MPGLEGTTFGGRYHLQRRLGRGGMAEVYLATDERMHRDIAIKVVGSNQADFAERFAREAEAMGNMHHDHILPAYDYGEQSPWLYLIMPYIEHGTLADLLKKGSLKLDHAGELLQQMASGLQYAHQRGFIHRDIKPSNILLRDDHYAYLADFGLARALEGGSDLTQTGTLLGTPEYMAPELAERPASRSSDVYALAIVLYQMVSGRVPFRGETAISIFWKHVRELPSPPSQFNIGLPKAVDRVLMRALDKDPDRRYATPMALSQAFQQAISGLEEMPALYDAETFIEPAQQAQLSPPPVASSPEQQRVVLPGAPVIPATPVARRSHPPVTPARPREFDVPTDIMTPGIATMQEFPLSPPGQRRRNGRLLGGVAIGLVFLLVVSGLLFFLTYQRNNQPGITGVTATVDLAATNAALFTQDQQTQTIQTATSVAATSTANAQSRSNAQATATGVAATATVSVQATATNAEATATTITGTTPVLTDSLSGQDGNNWSDDGDACTFANSGYNVSLSRSDILQLCVSGELQYASAAFQIDVTLVSAANAGLIFRASPDSKSFYDFEITNDGQFFFRYKQNNVFKTLLHNTKNSAILSQGNSNTLLVIASGSTFQLFVNGTFVGQVQDQTFATGYLGVAAGTLKSDKGLAVFSSLNIYQVS